LRRSFGSSPKRSRTTEGSIGIELQERVLVVLGQEEDGGESENVDTEKRAGLESVREKEEVLGHEL